LLAKTPYGQDELSHTTFQEKIPLENGEIVINNKGNLQSSRKVGEKTETPISQQEATEKIKIAFNLSSEYSLVSVNEDEEDFMMTFYRYIQGGDILVLDDTVVAVIEKSTGEIYMYRKNFTPHLPSIIFSHKNDDILKLFDGVKVIKIQKILLNSHASNRYIWGIAFEKD